MSYVDQEPRSNTRLPESTSPSLTEPTGSSKHGTAERVQDLRAFQLPRGFRGRSALFVQFWWLCQSLLVHSSPQFMYGWRRAVLRAFGAKIGSGVLIRPSVTITYPWKVEIGDNAWVGDNVELYSLGHIRIGPDAVVSQGTYVCAGTHDHRNPTFAIEARPITIEHEAWVAAQAFICPGVTIGFGAVVAARSVVTRDVAPLEVVAGNPARGIAARL